MEITDKDCLSLNLTVVRHSESEFIKHIQSFKDANPRESMSHHEWWLQYDMIALEPHFVDPVLSPYGVELCEQLKVDLDKIHHVVYVSPFRRTLLTACHILKTHKNKEKLILVLEPLAREQMIHANTMMLKGQALRK